MPLIAYNLTDTPITLAAGSPIRVLPPSDSPPDRGPGVNVTAELRDLSDADYTALALQAVDAVTYVWTGLQEYSLGTEDPVPAPSPFTAGGGGGNVVTLKPYDVPGIGYVTTWAEAVTAVQAMQPGNTIFIDIDPWDPDDLGPYTIPAPPIDIGQWALNDTMIESRTTYCHGGLDWQSTPPTPGDHGSPWQGSDDPYRGMQILAYIQTKGHINSDDAIGNPCRITGCRGLKNLFFRGEMYIGSQSGTGNLTVDGGIVTVTRVAGIIFRPIDASVVPSILTISGSSNGNDGTFQITSWDLETGTVTYENGDASAESELSYSLDRCNAVFVNNETFGRYGDFILDNADFRQGGSQFGTFYVGEDGRSYIKLRNAASLRMGSTCVDGHLVVQGDGSPCRVGLFATYGNGWAKFYLTPGMEFQDAQCVTYDVYQSTIWYTPSDGESWDGSPDTHHEALDQLAARTTALETSGQFTSVPQQVYANAPGEVSLVPGGWNGNLIVIADTSAAGNNITSSLGNGRYSGQEVTLMMGPMAPDKTWVVTPVSPGFLSGSATHITFAGLFDTMTLIWLGGMSCWAVKATYNTPVVA